MQLKTFVILASIAATLASSNGEVADDHNDHVALLQGQIEEKRARKADTVDAEAVEDYQLAQPLKCADDQGAAITSEAFDITGATEQEGPVSAGTVREWIAANTIKKDMVDPPGASELRVVLQLMFCLLILDGMWRFWKKSQGNSCSQMVDIDEATMKSSWVELVNAANSGNERCFKTLHGHPSTLTHVDAWGCTALHFAAVGGSATIVTELLQQGVEIDALDAHDETPLHFAARAGHVSTCEVLVNAGAKIDAVNGKGLTPLVIAGEANQQSTCRFLVDQGAGVGGLTDEELPPIVVSQIVLKVFTA